MSCLNTMKKKKKFTKVIKGRNIKIIIGIGILITLFLIISLINLTKLKYSASDFGKILKENRDRNRVWIAITTDKNGKKTIFGFINNVSNGTNSKLRS